jgi:hypothetical protein
MRAFMMEEREKRMAKYEDVLTEEQFTQYNEMMEARRQQMRQQRDQGSGDQPQRGRGRR